MTDEANAQTTATLAVVALVRDESGRVLLASDSESGPWSCIGGGLADDEDPASGAVRLAQVDCGLTIKVGEVLAHLSGDAYRVLYECGADTTYQATVVDASVLGRTHDTSMRTRWFDEGELANASLDDFAKIALADLGLR